MAMLKITTVKADRRYPTIVEGDLVSPDGGELKREWNKVRVSTGESTLIVDLKNVIVISLEEEDFLFEMMNQGVKFICGGVHNRHALQQQACKIAM